MLCLVWLAKAVAVIETGQKMPEGKVLKGLDSVMQGDVMAKNLFADKCAKNDGEHVAAREALGDFSALTLRDGFSREKKVPERETVNITAGEQKRMKKRIDTTLFEL